MLVRPLSDADPALYRDGIRIESVVAPLSRFLAGSKPSTYLTNLLALEHAQRLGAHDALLPVGEAMPLLDGAPPLPAFTGSRTVEDMKTRLRPNHRFTSLEDRA